MLSEEREMKIEKRETERKRDSERGWEKEREINRFRQREITGSHL